MERSFDHVVDYLNRRGDALSAGLDPVGERSLSLSRQLRRRAVRGGVRDPEVLGGLADEHFPMEDAPFGYWRRRLEEGEARG